MTSVGYHFAAVTLLACLAAPNARASEAPPVEAFGVHGQLTYVEQETNGFASPYQGPNSLSPGIGRETLDVTLYLGARLWPGAEAWLNPEVDQGFGLDDTLGVAGFPSGEAYKVGRNRPYLRLPRAFLRQTLALGTATETVEATANQLAGERGSDRVVLTVGKFGVGDIFDASPYAHDPRGDFLNWTAIDAGTFDYAADAWGFTVGASAEWYAGPWTLRGGIFALSNVPNSEHLEPGGHEFQVVGEIERRFTLAGRGGRVLITGYESRARMARLEDALAVNAIGGTLDLVPLRQMRSRTGVHLLAEQQISDDLALFTRIGGASGNVEAYEFTDIDRAAALGASIKGARWSRPRDTLGVVAMVNGISPIRRRFLDAGGLGILVGDGRLPHASTEQIAETYYSLAVGEWGALTADYQYIRNPAYNTDRGPASVFAVRVHAQF